MTPDPTACAACCEVHKLGKCDAVFTCCDKCPTFFGQPATAAPVPLNRAPIYPPCGAIDPITLQDCANVKHPGATRCPGPHRYRPEPNKGAPCHSKCILDWPHYGEVCLV